MNQSTQSNAPSVGEQIRDLGSSIKDIARERLDTLRNKAGEYYETGKVKARQAEEKVEVYVRQKPIQAVLISAGIGFLAGTLLMRRRH